LLDPPEGRARHGRIGRDAVDDALQHDLLGVRDVAGEQEQGVAVLERDRELSRCVARRRLEMHVACGALQLFDGDGAGLEGVNADAAGRRR